MPTFNCSERLRVRDFPHDGVRRNLRGVPDGDLDATVRELIRERLEERGWTQGRLASATGLRQDAISDHLAGQGCLGPGTVEVYAQALGWASASELLAAAERRR